MKLRTSFGNLILVTLALGVAVSGCSTNYPPPRQWDGCGAIGGLVGAAAGAGSGIAIAYSESAHPHTDPLVATGVGGGVIGGIIGAVVGHEICDPLLPPPPPPPAPVIAQAPPPPPPPAPVERHEKLVLRGVHFDFNKSKIRPGDAAILDEAAEILKSHSNVTIYDDGYCDAIGSEEYNLKLSQRRAEAVARYLEDQGIPETRIIPRGFGKTDFVAPNDTDEGRAQNRRVELKPTE
ncbi:MAG TPA: OmpA family protein [Candidatus Binataceae bacterium]|nr:OmpA family protein [Candidatus Binataceae bacterium]